MTTILGALRRAWRASQRDNRLRFVVADGTRFRILLRRPTARLCYWTNGIEAGDQGEGRDHDHLVPSWGPMLGQ